MWKKVVLCVGVVALCAAQAMAQRGAPERQGQDGPPPRQIGDRQLPTGPAPGERLDRDRPPRRQIGDMRQPARPGRGDEDTQDLLERVMLARMAQELDLSDEKLVRVVRQLGEFRESLHTATQARRELLRGLRASVAENGKDRGTLLTQLLEKDREIDTLRDRVQKSLAKTLDAEEHAHVYLFLEGFDGQMRGLLERARERGFVDDPPPPGRPGSGVPGMFPPPPPRENGVQRPVPPQRPQGPVRPERPGELRPPSRPMPPTPPQNGPSAAPIRDEDAYRDTLRQLLERRRGETEDAAPAP